MQCGDGYTVAASVDGELLLWGRRSKTAVGSDDCLSPAVNSDVVVAAADTSRHLDICSPTQLTMESGAAKGHSRKPSGTSISSGAGAEDTCATKNSGIYSLNWNCPVIFHIHYSPSLFLLFKCHVSRK